MWRRSLAAASARSHLGGVAGWVLGAGLVMAVFGPAYRGMADTFKGGAAAFGAAAQATAEAMRPLAGPSYRLDTYTGYVTYHNLAYLALFLAVFAAVMGARAIRGDEERGLLELYLAAGYSRVRVLAERAAGFLAALAVIALGLGAATGLGCALAGEPAWGAALVVAAEATLLAAVFYAAGLLAGQLFATARAAAGITTGAALVLFFLNNLAPQLGPLAALRFVSPFFYFEQSRYAMVPGHGADPAATLAQAAIAAGLIAVAAAVFARRDLFGGVFARRQHRERRPPLPGRAHPSLATLATTFLFEQRLGLLAWFLGPLALEAMYLGVFSQVRDVWSRSDIVKALISVTGDAPLVDGYISFTVSFAALIAAAFGVVQAGRWLGDRGDRREEMYLAAAPVSRLRLLLERVLAAAAGIALLAAGTIAGLLVGAALSGESLHADALARMGGAIVLLGLAVLGLSAALVAWLRSGFALGALATLLGASYFVMVLQPLFRWPDWTLHLSLFDAFGTPYVSESEPAGVALLAGLAIAGAVLAATLTARRSEA